MGRQNSREKKKFNLSDCIVKGDARRLEAGKEPVKTLRKLVHKMFEGRSSADDLQTRESLYQMLYRYENSGFYLNTYDKLSEEICDILMVNKDELVSKI